MKHSTIRNLAKKARKEIKTDTDGQRQWHRIFSNNKVIVWGTHNNSPNRAECVSIEGNGYSHNVKSIKMIKQVLGI